MRRRPHGASSWAELCAFAPQRFFPREREIVILRIGFLCRSGDQWTQHTRIGRQSGLTENEIEAIKHRVERGLERG